MNFFFPLDRLEVQIMGNNNKFEQGDVDAIDSFLSLACYNGYEEDVTDIMNELHKMFESTDKFDSARRPDWKIKCGRDKVNEFGGIFWSWLVLQYGDYGTSPRYGWIYKEDAKNLYDIMQAIYDTDGEYVIEQND